jgi:23S rRNA (pseudouridine1915-N3)-methyltransferase
VRVRVIAVGTRMPAWVKSACDDYLTRLKPGLGVSLQALEPATRTAAGDPQRAVTTEGRRLLEALRPGEFVAALDERGTQLSTRELAAWLKQRMQEGTDLAFLIGGADGLAPQVLERANFKWSLSRLTLPHAMVRVLLSEQLYRAHSILANHPYHRD